VLLVPVNEYKVTIRGRNYFMKTDKDLDFVNRTVETLNRRLSEVEKSINTPDTQKIAVMAAFSFAAECADLIEEKNSAESKIEEIINKTG